VWTGKPVQIYTEFDVDGNPYVNTAGDRLRDAPPITIYHAMVSLTRFERQYNPVKAASYAGTVNGTNWFACPYGTAKMEWPDATLTWIQEMKPPGYLWRITYKFEIAPEGWLPTKSIYNQSQFADRGRRCFKSVSEGGEEGKLYPARNDDGTASGDEVFLDGHGYEYTVNYRERKLPIMLPFKQYYLSDFNSLGLP
jgi:hypothetical protein